MLNWLFGKKRKFIETNPTEEERKMEKTVERQCVNCTHCKRCPDPPVGYMVARYKCALLDLPVKDSDRCKYHKYSKTSIRNFRQRELIKEVITNSELISK